MKKTNLKRKILSEDGTILEDISGYKFNHNGIDYGVYNAKENMCQHRDGYISILICDNEKCTGLSFSSRTFKTIRECKEETNKIIDSKKNVILSRIREA